MSTDDTTATDVFVHKVGGCTMMPAFPDRTKIEVRRATLADLGIGVPHVTADGQLKTFPVSVGTFVLLETADGARRFKVLKKIGTTTLTIGNLNQKYRGPSSWTHPFEDVVGIAVFVRVITPAKPQSKRASHRRTEAA